MQPNPQPYFCKLPDPGRQNRNKLHNKLEDIVMLPLSAVLSGGEDWVSLKDCACENAAWLRQFLELPNGIPSHDTLSDVMGRIDPPAFAKALAQWVQADLPDLAAHQVAIDGKTLWGSRGRGSAVHLISAFAAQARWVLAVEWVADKSNEITALAGLLEQLNLRGAVVTSDAMGCPKPIAPTVVDKQADYVWRSKATKASCMKRCDQYEQDALPVLETVEKDHGRIETRRVVLSTEIDWLNPQSRWPALKAVAMVESTRTFNNKSSCERRYYLSSLDDLPQLAQAIRAHESIENQQHWVLDVQFREDDNRTCKNHSAANLALIRRTALNLLQQDQTSKLSIRRRKMRALSNLKDREQLLFGKPL